MNSFKIEKILVPIDFSETSMLAIEHAGFIAQTFNAELILLHVVEKHWEKFNIVVPELRVNAPDDLINAVERRLEEISASIHTKYGVKSNCITANGHVFSEINSISDEREVDLIVMGTHGTSGFVEHFVGSTTYKVVTHSECPVISVQVHSDKLGFKDILLPIDDSSHSRQKVSHAIVMAKHFNAKIHVVGLANTHNEADLEKFDIKLEKIEEFIRSQHLSCNRELLVGTNQATMTSECAKAIKADLIIIMTDQEENITGRLMGTFAQQIINTSKIPVMSIRPVVSAGTNFSLYN